MAHRVHFHPLARTDLLDLYRYIEAQSGPARAGNYLDRVERLCISLAEFPQRTLPRDDLAPGVRTVAMERRVVIALRLSGVEVTVLRVLYAGRSLQAGDVPR